MSRDRISALNSLLSMGPQVDLEAQIHSNSTSNQSDGGHTANYHDKSIAVSVESTEDGHEDIESSKGSGDVAHTEPESNLSPQALKMLGALRGIQASLKDLSWERLHLSHPSTGCPANH